eukprot:231927-Alexandrium_andersonii.AAC.1
MEGRFLSAYLLASQGSLAPPRATQSLPACGVSLPTRPGPVGSSAGMPHIGGERFLAEYHPSS